jgi:hypothetical protein
VRRENMIRLLELCVGEEVHLQTDIPIDDCGTYGDVLIKVEMPFDYTTTQVYVLSKHGRRLYRVRPDDPLKDNRLIMVTKPDILWLESEQGGKSDEERVRVLTVVVGKVLGLPVGIPIETDDCSYKEVASRVGYVGDDNPMFSGDSEGDHLVSVDPNALADDEELLVVFGPGIIPSIPLEMDAQAVAANQSDCGPEKPAPGSSTG